MIKTARNTGNVQPDDSGISIIEDDIRVDREKINEERRAYLEESRSQEAV